MEKWTDKKIKQNVEELIEESYLLGLCDTEIQQYFQDFIETCESALHTIDQKGRDLKVIEIRMALLKANLLLGKNSFSIIKKQSDASDSDKSDKSAHDLFAEQVVATKNLILRRIEEYDSKLVETILEKNREKAVLYRKNQKRITRLLFLLTQLGYLVLFVLTGFLVWIVLFH